MKIYLVAIVNLVAYSPMLIAVVARASQARRSIDSLLSLPTSIFDAKSAWLVEGEIFRARLNQEGVVI